MTRYFVFGYGNASDEPFIAVCSSEEEAYHVVAQANNAGMLTSTYTEDQMWKMRSDAMQYNIQQSNQHSSNYKSYTNMVLVLKAEGYLPAQMESIDMEIAQSIPCPECRGRTHGRGWRSGDSYRAFSVCFMCDHCEEF